MSVIYDIQYQTGVKFCVAQYLYTLDFAKQQTTDVRCAIKK